MAEFLTGLISGGVLWEVLKSGFGYLFDEHKSKKSLKVGTLLAQVQSLKDKVEPIWLLTVRYYGDLDGGRPALSREILANLSSFAREWNQVDMALRAFGYEGLKGFVLISLRQSVTMHLDDCGNEVISIDHPIAQRLAVSVTKTLGEIQRVQIALHS